jgi:hypothetical protein
MKPDKITLAEKKAAELLMQQADIAIEKLKSAADLAANVLASAKESSDRDFQLQSQISKLEGITTTGFKAIDDHFRVLNGQVLDHSKLFAKILAKDNVDIGKNQGISLSWQIFLAIAGLIVAILGVIYYAKSLDPPQTNSYIPAQSDAKK